MSSVSTVNNNNLDPVTSTSGTTTSSSTSSSTSTTDSISSASGVSLTTLQASNLNSSAISLTEPSLKDWFGLVYGALSSSKFQQFVNEVMSNQAFNKLVQGLGDNSAQIAIAIVGSIGKIGSEIFTAETLLDQAATAANNTIQTQKNTINSNKTAINNAVSDYNTAVQTYNDAVDQAQKKHNKGDLTDAQYTQAINNAISAFNSDSAVTGYNATVNPLNTSNSSASDNVNSAASDYKTAQQTYDTSIQKINQEINNVDSNIQPVTPQDQNQTTNTNLNYNAAQAPSATTSLSWNGNVATPPPSVSDLSYSTSSPLLWQPITVTEADDFIGANLGAVLNSLSTTDIITFTQLYNTAVTSQKQDSFTESNAYIQRKHTLPTFSTVNASGGAGLAQITQVATGTSSVTAIFNAIHDAFNQIQGTKVPMETLVALSNATVAISNMGGLLAATALAGNLGAAGWSSAHSNMAFGITNAETVASQLQQDAITEQVKAAIQQTNPGIDPATLNKLTAIATVTVSQQLANLSLNELSQDLKAGSTTQSSPSITLTSNISLRQILNENNITSLTQKLIETLENKGIQKNKAQNFANEFASILSKQDITTGENLYSTYQNALVQAEQKANIILTAEQQAAVITQTANQILADVIIVSLTKTFTALSQAQLSFIRSVAEANREEAIKDKEDAKKSDILKEEIAKQDQALDIAHEDIKKSSYSSNLLFNLINSFQQSNEQNYPGASVLATESNINFNQLPPQNPNTVVTGNSKENTNSPSVKPVSESKEGNMPVIDNQVYFLAKLFLNIGTTSLSSAGSPGDATGKPQDISKGKASIDVRV